jgi:hypothetical protein
MRFVEQRTPMGGSTEAQARLAESVARHPAQRLFITPQPEVETLCRLALLRYLDECDAELAGAAVTLLDFHRDQGKPTCGVGTEVCSRLVSIVERLNVVDPACGEGHMLVGALELLDRLLTHAHHVLGSDTNPRTRRVKIIQNNLYGVEAQRETLAQAQHHLGTAAGESNAIVTRAISANLIHGDALLWRDESERNSGFRQVLDSGGFHLVLGNPPYVRHEMIADPLQRLPAAEYKHQVFAAVESTLASYAHDALDGGNLQIALSRRSDLSVLFTVVGLSLLAPGGVLGFVLPNAVSSARYGEALWRLLDSDSFEGHMIEDFARRSFAKAAVNTALLIAHRRTDHAGPQSRRDVPTPNQFPHEIPTTTDAALRGPGLFEPGVHELDSRIEHCCTSLSSIGRLRYPIKTGLNSFFYPDVSTRERFGIEREFLIPVVKSPRDIRAPAVSGGGLSTVLFHCPHSLGQLHELGATGALAYIAWGEEQTRVVSDDGVRTARPWPSAPSLRGRERWYSVPLPGRAQVLCPRFIHQRFFFALPTGDVLLDQTFYGLELSPGLLQLRLLVGALLNSSLTYLMVETHGRTGLGDGVRQFALRDMAQLPVPDPELVPAALVAALTTTFERLASRRILPIEEEVGQADRRELDSNVCRALGLSEALGAEARGRVTALVQRRLERARSW